MCAKNELLEMMKTFIEYSQIEKAAKAEKEKAKKEISDFLKREGKREEEKGKVRYFEDMDGIKATLTEYTSHKFDSKVFQADNPEMYEKYKLPKNETRFSCN